MSAWVEVEPIHLTAAAMVLRKQRARVSPFTRLPLYPKQAAIVDDPARFTMTEATTKAGKTMSHIEWLLDSGIRMGEGEHWWGAPVYPQAAIAFRRSCDRLRGFISKPDGRGGFALHRVADPIPFTPNKSELTIECQGARFVYRSAEKPDNLYGEDVRTFVGDEISRWREEAWHAVYSTLTATKGRAKLIGNVKGRRNFSWNLARKAEAGEPDWSYHKLTADDAVEGGILERAIIEQAKRDLPEHVFRQLYMAEAADDEGNPFGIDHIRSCLAPLSDDLPVVYGWDLAKTVDWTVGIGLDSKGRIAAFHRFQHDWAATRSEIVRITGARSAVVDSTGVGNPIVEDLQKSLDVEGYNFSPKSKQQLMDGLRSALHSRETTVLAGPLQNELEAFEYEYTASGVRFSAPEGMHDDCVCAHALALHALRTQWTRGDISDFGGSYGNGSSVFNRVEVPF